MAFEVHGICTPQGLLSTFEGEAQGSIWQEGGIIQYTKNPWYR